MLPAELRPLVICEEPLRIRFAQKGLPPGLLTILLIGAALVLLGLVAGIAGEWGPGASMSILGALTVSVGLLPRHRWVEVAHVHDGWQIEHGVGRSRTRSAFFEDAKVMTTGVLQDNWRPYDPRNRLEPAQYFLRVDFLALPFAGAPPAVDIAEGLGASAEELTALGQVIESFAPNRIRRTAERRVNEHA
jgi:hypothetical protein